jgi:DNA repair protein RadC
VKGVGQAKAVRLAAAMELGRRALCEAVERRPAIMSFQEVRAWAEPRLVPLEHEELWLLCLDGQNALKSWRCVALGGLSGCALSVRDVLGHALRDNASAIVLVHNHPSGCPEPSADDVHMTEQLARACRVVGTPLLDHVVVARGGAVSLFERGLVV